MNTNWKDLALPVVAAFVIVGVATYLALTVQPIQQPKPAMTRQPANGVAVERKPAPTQPKDAKVVAFQAGIERFVEEARSVVRAMDLIPDVAAYKRRVEAVEEAYSRIPDPPAGNTALDICHKAARQITVDFGVGSLQLEFVNDFLRLGSKEHAESSIQSFRKLASQQKARLAELEAAVTEIRAPKIELSKVIKGQK
jgi:hypothetical protein